jgi:hypothetical protein
MVRSKPITMEQPATNSTYAPVEYLERIDSDSFSDDEERNRALLAAYALIGRLETPWETVARICMNQVSPIFELTTCPELRLHYSQHSGHASR